MERLSRALFRLANLPVRINGKVYSRYESRGRLSYELALFPENPLGLGEVGIAYAAMAMYLAGRDYPLEYRYYALDSQGMSDFSVLKPFEARKKFGSQKEMFKVGATILDLGSGAGVAKHDYQKVYPKTIVIGLDPYNGGGYPVYSNESNYVAGKWQKLPFKDNALDGILACETFPRHSWDKEEIYSSISELTRVCKEGAVFRGTYSANEDLLKAGEDGFLHPIEGSNKGDAVVSAFVNNGWEVCTSPSQVTARLIKKRDCFWIKEGDLRS